MKNQWYFLCLLLTTQVLAQAPVSETIHVNSVEAKVWSNGALFGFNNEQSFKIPISDDDNSVKLKGFRRVVPWIGGYDDFGNLRLAAIAPTGNKSDFASGLVDIEGYNQIWKVTKPEIRAHWEDFLDNGIINNPNPAVMEWPGTWNIPQHSFDVGNESPEDVAPYWDQNSNGLYDPLNGDHPIPLINWLPFVHLPDEMYFFAFHDKYDDHEVTHGSFMNMQVFCTIWAYSCPEEPALHNSIFVSIEYWNRGIYPIDSLHFGFLLNFEIGNGNDDFIGCIPGDSFYESNEILYGYNGDSLDQNGFEEATPIIALFPMGNDPIDFNFFSESTTYFMNVGNSGATPAGIGYPISPQEFYRYLTGHWADGTPLRAGGNGYHPQDTSAPVKLMYPGDPTDTIGWSEPTTGNTPNLRRAIVSFKCPRMNPGDRQRRSFCFNWARQMDAATPLKAALEQIQFNKSFLDALWQWDSPIPISTPPCLSWDHTSTADLANSEVIIYPNPLSDVLRVSSNTDVVEGLWIIDISGKIRYSQTNLHSAEISIHPALPSGMYFLTVLTHSNKRITQKLVIQR